MERLTPNLWAYSAFEGTLNVISTRELDFNLARRSAIIVNRVIGQLFAQTTTTSGHGIDGSLIQELDTDPDNVDIEFAGALRPEGVVLDSSRCFRQLMQFERDTAAGVESHYHTLLQKDWTNEDELKRPISITPLRHHVSTQFGIASAWQAEIAIDYFIVELSLEEIGIINASRR